MKLNMKLSLQVFIRVKFHALIFVYKDLLLLVFQNKIPLLGFGTMIQVSKNSIGIIVIYQKIFKITYYILPFIHQVYI
jgi:hypothetical protein